MSMPLTVSAQIDRSLRRRLHRMENYARNPDIEQLRWAYPRLKKWHECGSRTAAMTGLERWEPGRFA